MATYLEAEGDVIYSDPPREVETITERKGETQTRRMIMIIGAAAWDYKEGQWVTHQSTDFLDPIHLSSVCRSIFDHVATADNLGYSNLNGRSVYHLAVTYPSGSSSAADAWIDSATRYVYLYQAHSGNGNDSIEYTIKYSRFNDTSIKIEPP
jgi:hypothetical protein